MILADFALVMTLLPASVIILETKINPWWKRTCKKEKVNKEIEKGTDSPEIKADLPQPRHGHRGPQGGGDVEAHM